jgi:hypothetical protein
MFDPVTAAFLRTAPALPELDPATLPQTLTERYAELVARRLRLTEGGESPRTERADAWPLTRIADAYELVASINPDPSIRRAAAFVAGTAQQILAQERQASADGPILNRDRVDPDLSASLLFLAAEQYGDAFEAGRKIRIPSEQQGYAATLLAEDIRDLATRSDYWTIAARAAWRCWLRSYLVVRLRASLSSPRKSVWATACPLGWRGERNFPTRISVPGACQDRN